MQVRSVAESAKKFKDRASAARGDYASGVQNAGGHWLEGAAAASESWKAGTQEAINRGTFEKGVRAAGAAKYQTNATKLGPDRFVTGVQNAEPTYAAAVQPFSAALASASLPPRGARGSSSNAARVVAVMELMRKTRMERLGA